MKLKCSLEQLLIGSDVSKTNCQSLIESWFCVGTVYWKKNEYRQLESHKELKIRHFVAQSQCAFISTEKEKELKFKSRHQSNECI